MLLDRSPGRLSAVSDTLVRGSGNKRLTSNGVSAYEWQLLSRRVLPARSAGTVPVNTSLLPKDQARGGFNSEIGI